MTLFAHRGFAPSLLIASMVCAASPLVWRRFVQRFVKMPTMADTLLITAFAFLEFCLWIGVTSFWTPLGGRGDIFLNVLLPVLCAGAVCWSVLQLPYATAKVLGWLFACAIVLTLFVLAFETFTGGWLRSVIPPDDLSWNRHKDFAALGRGAGAMVMMVFPAALVIYLRFGGLLAAVGLVALATISAIGLGISSNALALAAGSLTGLTVWRFPKTGMRLLAIMLVVALFITPMIAIVLPAEELNQQLTGILPVSWLQRFYIWEAIGKEIPSGLPFGHGVDYARWLARDSAIVDIPGAYGPLPVVPTHPHNVFLQIWLETGIPGVLLLATIFWFGGKYLQALKIDALIKGGIAALVMAVFVSFMVEASIWQVWRHCVIGIAVLGLILAQRSYVVDR